MIQRTNQWGEEGGAAREGIEIKRHEVLTHKIKQHKGVLLLWEA